MKRLHPLVPFTLVVFICIGGLLSWNNLRVPPSQQDLSPELQSEEQLLQQTDRSYAHLLQVAQEVTASPVPSADPWEGASLLPVSESESSSSSSPVQNSAPSSNVPDTASNPNPNPTFQQSERADSRPERMEPFVRRLSAPSRSLYEKWSEVYPQVDFTHYDQAHSAQTALRKEYPATLNAADREDFVRKLMELEALHEAMVKARAEEEKRTLNGVDEQGVPYTIVAFQEDGTPLLSQPENDDAAVSTAASFIRRQAAFDSEYGPDIDGSGFQVNVNDHGTIYLHAEFEDRVTVMETNDSGSRDHMTHVAGTIGAKGIVARAMGMAPSVEMLSFIQQSTSDIYNYGMTYPGEPGKSIVGNTSLGGPVSSGGGGAYSFSDVSFDNANLASPYYLHFYSAGNSGSGWDTLTTSYKESKNIVTVANVNDVSRDSSGNMTGGGAIRSSSSRGPADDGRIKPDLSGNGVSLYSPSSLTGYSNKTGTSMASPNAAGTAVLLQDYFNKRFPGHYMRAATLRTLLIHGADDLGNTGPDYIFGWGLINALASGNLIKAYADNPAARRMVEADLAQGETDTYTFTYNGSGPIRATLGWWDPAGTAGTSSGSADDRVADITNDLNVKVISPSGTEYLPWVMPFVINGFNESDHGTPATTGVNTTDTTEMVLLNSPGETGVWTVEISHVGTLEDGPQQYSLILDGPNGSDTLAPLVLSSVSPENGDTDQLELTLTGSGFLLGADVILRRSGEADVPAYAQRVLPGQILARVDLASAAKGYWDVVVRNPDGTEEVLENGFLVPISGGGGTLLPPVFTSTPPVEGTEGDVYTYAITTNDGDTSGSSLTLSAVSVPAWLGFTDNGNGTATLTGTPGNGDSGLSQISLSVTDGSYVTQQVYELLVFPLGGNTAPVISTTSLPETQSGLSYSTDVTATDGEGQNLTLTTTTLPAWLTFTDNGDNTGTFSGSPSDINVGTVNLTLSAFDGFETTDQALSIVVHPKAQVTFTSSSGSVNEDVGSGQISLTVNRTTSQFGSVTVSYATSNNGANAGSDYTSSSGTLTWADGEWGSRTIVVPILNDSLTEGNEAFRVTLSNLGGTGASELAISQQTVTIQDDEHFPVASFTANPVLGATPLPVTFDASSSSDSDPGDVLTYTWDFGDSNNGTGLNPQHTYTSAGSFTVMLTVDDGNGGTDSTTRTVTVVDPLIASAGASPLSGNAPLEVSFTGSATGGAGEIPRDPSSVATTDLIVHLNFNQGSGTQADDQSTGDPGGSNHGTLANGASWVSDGLAGAVQFDGNNDLITFSDSSAINTADQTDRTVALWFKADDASSGTQVLFEEGGGTNGAAIYLSGGNLYVDMWVGSTFRATLSNPVPNDGAWHHAAFTYTYDSGTSSGYMKGYLDGTLFGTETNVDVFSSHSDDTGIGDVNGSTNLQVGGGDAFAGLIDEFRLYNRPLSDAEISEIAIKGYTYSWDFKDGNFSTAQNPVHTFNTAGTYVVEVSVSDGLLTDVDTVTIEVSEPGPGVRLTESAGTTEVSEDGQNDTYTLVLMTQPIADVTVNLSPDSQLSVDPTSIVFTSGNWDQVRTVTVSAVDDHADETQHSGIITHTVSSGDPDYNGATVDNLTVSIEDNDENFAPEITLVSPTSSTVAIPSGVGLMLDTTVTDDGLPIPPGALTLTWSKVSGPGTLTWDHPDQEDTGVQFSADGDYVLRLTADDGSLQTTLDVEVEVGAGGPVPLTSEDVGAVAAAGSSSLDNGIWTVTGSGADIWNSADEFRFVYAPLAGDGSITAEVTITNNPGGNSWAKAGLMIRETTSADSKNVMVHRSASNGNRFQTRDTTGGGTNSAGSGDRGWLRLERSGDTFTGYASDDGLVWTQLGSSTVSMNTNVLIGLGVTSHSDGNLTTATFASVESTAFVAEAGALVDAGADGAAQPNVALPMAGVVDGTPTLLWQRISGGGSVVFGDQTSADSDVTFDTEGSQILRLLATQFGITTFDDVTVTVEAVVVDNNNNDVPDDWETLHEDSQNPGTVLLGDGNNYNIRDVFFWGLQSGSPAPLQTHSPAMSGGSFAFQFFGVDGVTYRVSRTPDLTDSNGWQPLLGYESVDGMGGSVTVSDNAPPVGGAYRVEVIEP